MATNPIKGKYEGYFWESDKQAPQIYKGENLLEEKAFDSEKNPFIIEGQFFDRTTGHSVSIKYVDGEYLIKEYYMETSNEGKTFYVMEKDENGEDVKREVKCKAVEQHYKGNSKLEGNNLRFYELWEEKPDPFCCNMNVLEATKIIFAGFLINK